MTTLTMRMKRMAMFRMLMIIILQMATTATMIVLGGRMTMMMMVRKSKQVVINVYHRNNMNITQVVFVWIGLKY
jgi:hypothetical protein